MKVNINLKRNNSSVKIQNISRSVALKQVNRNINVRGASKRGLPGIPGASGPVGATGSTGPQGNPGTGVNILGTKNDPSELPMKGNTNEDGYLIDGMLWVW